MSNDALATLREELLPATLGTVSGIEYAVTGDTAASKDWNDAMRSAVPIVFTFVLAFAFLLLLVSFRSLVIPVKAILMNLLSVAAAYGVVVVTFQWGWGENLLDFNSNGGVAAWLPMFLFVILFGLSMDYHVFILSRVREYYDRGLDTEHAVAKGIKSTAGVVTSAAVVMVLVFGVFALMPIIDMKEMGVGLAAAILIDATIVRAVLLPATMKLLGKWNWYLPRRGVAAEGRGGAFGQAGARSCGAGIGEGPGRPSRTRLGGAGSGGGPRDTARSAGSGGGPAPVWAGGTAGPGGRVLQLVESRLPRLSTARVTAGEGGVTGGGGGGGGKREEGGGNNEPRVKNVVNELLRPTPSPCRPRSGPRAATPAHGSLREPAHEHVGLEERIAEAVARVPARCASGAGCRGRGRPAPRGGA